MRKNYFLLSLLFVFTLPNAWAETLKLSINAPAAILINAETGKVLFEKNAHVSSYPASITKVATAIYALKMMSEKRLEEKMVASQEAIASISSQAKRQSNYRSPAHWLETDGTHMGIKRGEEIPFVDLLYGMLLVSANDAANVIAEHIGGTIPAFVEKMNNYLRDLGCKDTHFCNPHGLHHPNHVTTAHDMALITREALKNPLFRQIVSTLRYVCPQTNLQVERNFVQYNALLKRGNFHYSKALGVKTGYTSSAGKTLVAAAEDRGRSLIAVILGCQGTNDRYEDAIKMFEGAFQEPLMRRQILPKGPQKLTRKVHGAKQTLKTYLTDGLNYDFYPAEQSPIKVTISWKDFVLPIQKDQEVACITVADTSGKILKKTPLLAQENLSPTRWHKIKSALIEREKKSWFFLLGGTSLSLCLVVFGMRRLRFR